MCVRGGCAVSVRPERLGQMCGAEVADLLGENTNPRRLSLNWASFITNTPVEPRLSSPVALLGPGLSSSISLIPLRCASCSHLKALVVFFVSI